jgi:phenylacetate-CoA ligase
MSAPSFADDPSVLDHAPSGQLPGLLEAEIRRIYERSLLYGQRFPLHAGPLHWPCYREIPAL